EPRLLAPDQDLAGLEQYFRRQRIVRDGEVAQFRELLTPERLEAINASLQRGYRDTEEFRDYLRSVLLHSLATVLKRLVGRLGGVGGDELVAYADMPLLRLVDRTVNPRILIIDTVAGGSGGVAQAFERLDLT